MTNKTLSQTSNPLPETGISGVYEVMMGVQDIDYAFKYFEAFGFNVVASSAMTSREALDLYGVNTELKSHRLQNGSIDSHGLLRLLEWDKPLGPGIGYSTPETIGQRISVMRTEDIFRLYDIYENARAAGEKWLLTFPVSDDLFDLDSGKKGFFNRPVVVRENAVYGEFFNHIFFQRYGYHIPGYGTIGPHAPLRTSEFTHHDFIINAPNMAVMSYLGSALGLQAEEDPVLDGDWQPGPKAVFMMEPGESHWYQGFVSPNNICGKLKFFIPTSVKVDRSARQRIGELGISLHSFYTSKLDYVYELVTQHDLKPTQILANEFNERSFVFTGPAGCSWQIIEKHHTDHTPETELKFELTNH